MDQAWVPLQGGCTLWAAGGWGEGAGGGDSGGVSGDDGGDDAVHMNGVPVHADAVAGKICEVGGGSVVVAAEVAAVAAAVAVGTRPGTGSLAGDSEGAWSGNPGVAVGFPACAAGNATTVHAEDRCGEEQEVPQAEMGSTGNPHLCAAVTAVHMGRERASVPDPDSRCE